jgi:hypothetical protein
MIEVGKVRITRTGRAWGKLSVKSRGGLTESNPGALCCLPLELGLFDLDPR